MEAEQTHLAVNLTKDSFIAHGSPHLDVTVGVQAVVEVEAGGVCFVGLPRHSQVEVANASIQLLTNVDLLNGKTHSYPKDHYFSCAFTVAYFG